MKRRLFIVSLPGEHLTLLITKKIAFGLVSFLYPHNRCSLQELARQLQVPQRDWFKWMILLTEHLNSVCLSSLKH